MDLIRIGDKVIGREQIHRFVDRALELRAKGLSQQETADRLGADRTLISRLESIGEIRKGGVTGLIAFPVANRSEIEQLAGSLGLDFVLVLTNSQRWSFVEGKSGIVLLNAIMEIVARARECDRVVVAASNMWLGLAEAIFGPRLIALPIGSSPMSDDVRLDPQILRDVLGCGSEEETAARPDLKARAGKDHAGG